MSQKEELPFGLKKAPRVVPTHASYAELDDHLGLSYLSVQTWWSGEGFTLEIQNSNETHKADITWTQYEALKVSVESIQKAESKKHETEKPISTELFFGQTSLEILADTNMLELHDDNGPGSILCPVCGASVAMKWSNGIQTRSPDDIEHAVYCPIVLAKEHLENAKSETPIKPKVRRRIRAVKGKT